MTWLFKLTVDGEHEFVSLCSVCCGRRPAPIVTDGTVKNDPDVLNRSPQPRIRVRNQRPALISRAGYLFVNYFLIDNTTETEQYSIPSIILCTTHTTVSRTGFTTTSKKAASGIG